MFARTFAIVLTVATLTGLAAAVPQDLTPMVGPICPSGHLQCCKSAQPTDHPYVVGYFEYFGIPPPPSGTQVGFTCFPIPVDRSGPGCAERLLCCEKKNTFNGVATGCSPPVYA